MNGNPLISRLMTVLGAPAKTEDIPGFLDEYDRLTGHFDKAVLDKAATMLIAEAGRQWPTPKACVEACRDAQEKIHGKPSESNWNMPWEIRRRESYVWARQYCDLTSLGKQAKAEGWDNHLYYYACSYYRNCPPGHTVMAMVDWRPPQDIIDTYRGVRSRKSA